MYEIKPLADGYGLYKDGTLKQWCYAYEWAQFRQEEMEKADKNGL